MLIALPLLGSAGEVLSVEAENVNGRNRYLGQVRYLWDFLDPPLNEAGANTIGEFNFPQPFGGVPNAYVTDGGGNATFTRDLDLCPM
jgi:hypothetical protein